MFRPILQKFSEKSPVTVMVQGLLERILNAKKIDAWFENVGEVQYTRKILFSSLVSMMLQVVCKVKKNVYSAYLNSHIDASRQAVYDKLKNIELKTTREMVVYVANEAKYIIQEIKGSYAPLLPGLTTQFIDGNCIESSEHRIQELRQTKAGALPGKSLVVFEPEFGLVTDLFPCEDGHAQERSLLKTVLETVKEKDAWVADRNFCTLEWMFGLHQKGAYFILRQHGNTPYKPLSEKEFVGETETGKVYEQTVLLTYEKQEIQIRRIVIKLHKPTRNGDKELGLFSNLERDKAGGVRVAEIYRKRWTIEIAFQKIESYLHSEINSLGYPKAALFGFAMALVAFNLYAVVMSAIQAAHPDKNIQDEISDYYVADEISSAYHGMMLIVEDEEWSVFTSCSLSELGQALLKMAGNIQLKRFKKNKRGPKNPSPPKEKYKGQPHVSTARLIS